MEATTNSRSPWKVRVSGTSALALSTVITNLLRIVSTVCLTRLLAPEVYGITGLILSVFYMINMVTDIGLQSYVVRHERSDDPDFLSSVYTIHAIRGVILAAIGVVVAWPLALVLAKPELAAPLAVASLVFVIDGHVSLHQFRGLRDGKVQRFAMIELISGVAQILSAIALAFLLRNVWAIVASMFVASAVRLWAGYALFPSGRHRLRRDRDVAADLWRFSRVIAVSSALTLVATQVDKLGMARLLSLSEFGTYVIATSLAGAPMIFAFNYASAIVYPAVAEAWRNGSSISDAYHACRGRFFYLYLFGGGVLIGAADLLVRLLYDPRYLAAGTYLSILAVSTSLAIATRALESVHVASGRASVSVQMNIGRLVWLTAGGILAFARWEPMIFVLSIGLVEMPAYAVALWQTARLHTVRWGREMVLPFVILAGFAAGETASQVGLRIFPNL